MSVTAKIRVKQIDHVTLVSEDLERSAAFYVGVLGMDEVARPAFAFAGKWFQAGSTMIHLNIAGEEAGKAGVITNGGTSVSRGIHIAFEVEDFDEAVAAIEAAGIEIVAGPQRRPDGPRQFYVFDPDQHLIEIYSRVG